MNKKELLMQAAEALFRSQQLRDITVDDVVQRAGVGKGTVYRHFADKDDLFFQTALRGFDEMCAALEAVKPGSYPERRSEGFRNAMLQACRTIRGFFQDRRPLFRMVLSEEDRTRIAGGRRRQQWLRHRKKMVAALAKIIARGVEAGDVPADLPPEVLAEYLLGMLRTCANELLGTPESYRSDEAVVDLFLHGAGGAGPDPGSAAN